MWLLILMLLLGSEPAFAQQQASPQDAAENTVNQQLNHKIKMIGHILNADSLTEKLQSSEDPIARDLIIRARENYRQIEVYMSNQQYLEASAVIDFVLRDITVSSQLLNVSDQQEKKFKISIEKFEAFALPDWKELNSDDNYFLQNTLDRIELLKINAIKNSETENYAEATRLVEAAYYLKVNLIERLPHDSNVFYDLKFSSVEDEYQYMTNRTYHYMELVDLALLRIKPDLQTRKLADSYIYLSMMHLEDAENLELNGKVTEAIAVLDKSINQLSNVLKMLGVKF